MALIVLSGMLGNHSVVSHGKRNRGGPGRSMKVQRQVVYLSNILGRFVVGRLEKAKKPKKYVCVKIKYRPKVIRLKTRGNF